MADAVPLYRVHHQQAAVRLHAAIFQPQRRNPAADRLLGSDALFARMHQHLHAGCLAVPRRVLYAGVQVALDHILDPAQRQAPTVFQDFVSILARVVQHRPQAVHLAHLVVDQLRHDARLYGLLLPAACRARIIRRSAVPSDDKYIHLTSPSPVSLPRRPSSQLR